MAGKNFNLSAFLPYRLAVLSERVSRRLAVEYERLHGLSVAEWRVLVHLLRHEKVSVREIHTCVNLDKPRVSRAVARLEAAGFVDKIQDTADARLVAISLTEKGLAALGDILPEAQTIEAHLLACLSPREVQSFFTVMEKLHGVLDGDPKARPRMPADVDGLRD
ncbi:MarR family winged helix-turn-helix transcriptional regulator [Roseibium sp. MMSF_3544]|uniref:MarR family winged helix-turn-helix transcriptional regulator n=1 Tax=unclassified Roseibium TaxID=2629323 RepID=UPI00273DE680|nr:MarR family winged helix-turn-helix transcriptional regulator [Roseibium sp. MMSF_3544]